jgi:hypothetical protein
MAVKRAMGRTSSRKRSCAGVSLLDVTIAMVVLTIALCGITGSIVAGDRLEGVNRETALAQAGVRGMMETLRGVSFSTVYSLYNTTTADDPGGIPVPGANFAVPGLRAVAGDPDGLPGEIIFPSVMVGGVLELHEDVNIPALGMPRDLNEAGGIDGLDHSPDYRILPVQVRVRWSGARGVRVLTAETILCAR